MKLKKLFSPVKILVTVVLFFIGSIILGLYGEYGGANIHRAIVLYIEDNNGDTPSSWEDITPYHSDPLLSCESTIIVRQFWDVNWDIDMRKLYESNKDIEDFKDYTSIIYNRKRVTDKSSVTTWDLGDRISQALEQTAEQLQ